MSHYQKDILDLLPSANARHVEAFMRDQHPTLDALSPGQFMQEASVANLLSSIDPNGAEKLARSFGL